MNQRGLWFGAIGFCINVVIFLLSIVPARAELAPCHLLDPGDTITEGFGVPWNVLSSEKELFLRASCTNTTTTIEIGPTTYVYNQGYVWTGSSWQLINLTCTGGALVSNAWCPISAEVTVSKTVGYYTQNRHSKP
jgi:hypothetical protein